MSARKQKRIYISKERPNNTKVDDVIIACTNIIDADRFYRANFMVYRYMRLGNGNEVSSLKSTNGLKFKNIFTPRTSFSI